MGESKNAAREDVGEHNGTEKLADPFLGLTLPFHYGCPDAGDYFPADSFIRIDIHDPAGVLDIIRRRSPTTNAGSACAD